MYVTKGAPASKSPGSKLSFPRSSHLECLLFRWVAYLKFTYNSSVQCLISFEMSSKGDKERIKALQEKHQAILAALLKDEDNKYCVDCDAKGRWIPILSHSSLLGIPA